MLDWLSYFLATLNNKKFIGNRKTFNIYSDKFSQLLFCEKNWFCVPKSIFFAINQEYTDKYINILENDLWYPIIAKIPNVDKWEWVFKADNRAELNEILLLDNAKDWLLFQEYIDNNWDYRVIVIWNDIIWSIKRYNEDSFKNNVSQWASVISYELPQFLKNISIDISNKYDNSIIWIDYFILDDGSYRVVEINSLPWYTWFESATWISIPLELLKYIKSLPE